MQGKQGRAGRYGVMNVIDININDFKKDLTWSELPAQYIQYLKAIIHWWPKVNEWDRIIDLVQQKQGKDITITLPDGEIKKLQFKSRRNDYGDFLIEYRHDYYTGNHSPGWIEKESDIDYLIYCSPKRIFRIEWLTLVNAWKNNKIDWIANYDLTPAENKEYCTRNVGILWNILKEAEVIYEEYLCGSMLT